MTLPKSLCLTLSGALAGALLLLVVSGSIASFEGVCRQCHEMDSPAQLWGRSSHRNVRCEDCHGLPGISDNWRRLFRHVTGAPAPLRLGEARVSTMVEKCKRCHEREYAGWLSSRHSARYRDLFPGAQGLPVREACLPCHGMFFELQPELLAGLPNSKSLPREVAERPLIPCSACHLIHSRGATASRPQSVSIAGAFDHPTRQPRARFYDRQRRRDVGPSVARTSVESAHASGDLPQSLCLRCHQDGPDSCPGKKSLPSRLSGVHEGLSCEACHATHSMETGHSCSRCHPRLSNCGVPVEAMDTSYLTRSSRHNIHSVRCLDCHGDTIPPRPKDKPASQDQPRTQTGIQAGEAGRKSAVKGEQ